MGNPGWWSNDLISKSVSKDVIDPLKNFTESGRQADPNGSN